MNLIKDELYISFLEYLSSKDIVLLGKFENKVTTDITDISNDIAEQQLYAISEFHKKVMGYKGYMGKRLDNKTGGIIEQFKVNVKRLKRYLKNIRMNSASTDFERMLLKVGFEYLQRAENCISEAYNSGYMNIIERSMKKTEICLGNTDFNGVRINSEVVEVSSIDKCCYNNVEMDCFLLLSKYKRRGVNLDYRSLVKKFCEFEELGENSYNFILALLSYPYAFMKCCNRYRERSKEWNEEEYEDKLSKALLKDGESLL
jgi:hypothetical protein